MSRQKGNRFERDVAVQLIAADGPDPHASGIASSTGRVGHLDVGADVISRRFVAEMKHRQSIAGYLWEWFRRLDERVAWRDHTPILVIKRDREQPLVVLNFDDFLHLIGEPSGPAD